MPHTLCRKALGWLLPVAALIVAVAAPALAQDSSTLVHSVEIGCHHDQRRAMAAMQEGLAVMGRELSGQMRLMDLDGIWCLRLGESADEAALRPVLAAVRKDYPQAAMVLGQVGRGRVVARVASRTPASGPDPVAAAPVPVPAAASPALPLAPLVPASRPVSLAEPALSSVAGPAAMSAKAAPGPELALGATLGSGRPAAPVPVAGESRPWPAWAGLALAAALLFPALGLWLRHRARLNAVVIFPHLRHCRGGDAG